MSSARTRAGADATVAILVDDQVVRAVPGTSVAAALLASGVGVFRRSVQGEARTPLCGMGICYECRVTIDDEPHRRACLVTVREGLQVRTATGEEA